MPENRNPQHGYDKKFEHDDPMELRAIEIPGGDEEMQVRVFIEEFLMMGTSKKELIEIFKSPFYAGTYRLYKTLGEKKIVSMIEEVFNS